MNDLLSTVGLMRREFRDVHAVVSRLDHQMRKLIDARPSLDRPGGLVARSALPIRAVTNSGLTSAPGAGITNEFGSRSDKRTSSPHWTASITTECEHLKSLQ